LEVNWRIPGDTTALAGDGDFLWIGAENYFGHYLVLLHKPTESLVSYASFRERISSLAVSGNSVWAGLAWGDQKLVRLSKDAFVSVPSRDWVRVAISPEERMRLVRTMKVRDQAMYAFYAGDSSRVVELLGNANPEKATLEEMFLLAFSYGTGGLDRPDQARVWFDRIISRYPDSPWARTAKQTLADNDQRQAAQKREADLLRRFDRNRDGALDNAERSVMEADPAYQREEAAAKAAQLDAQADAILQRYDSNRDEKLDRTELSTLKNLVLAYAQAPPEVMAGRTPALAPLINPDFPSETEILKKHDANADGALDGIEWKKFVRSRFRQN
jgi:hypothetical protein